MAGERQGVPDAALQCCQVHAWHPQFKSVAYPTEIVALKPEDTEYISRGGLNAKDLAEAVSLPS